MKITNLNLNNKEDKVKLLSIIYSNLEGDLTDSETEEQINNINDSSDDNNFIFSSKNLRNKIAIRILSSYEYNKYVINGTCDGSISADSNNVYHRQAEIYLNRVAVSNSGYLNNANSLINYNENTVYLDVGGNSSTYRVTFDVYVHMDTVHDNIEKTCNILIKENSINQWNIANTPQGKQKYMKTFPANSIYTINKDVTFSNLETCTSGGSDRYLYSRVQGCSSFRPCFNIIDNSKSANLFS